MDSLSTNYYISSLNNVLTANVTVTSVPTGFSIASDAIQSSLSSAMDIQRADYSKLAKMTITSAIQSLEERMLLNQATINYYSILNEIATQTATPGAMYTQAAQASAVMEKLFKDTAYLHGRIPSIGANAAVLSIFIILLIVHVVFGVIYHQWWHLVCWSIGLTMEAIGYAGRIWLAKNMFSYSAYVMQTVCLTLAPCFILAGMYYVMSQLVYIHGEQYSTFKPIAYGISFIICDTFSILLQAAGGGLSSSKGSIYHIGINIMIAGLSFQLFTMLIFQFLWYSFVWRVYKAFKQYGDSRFNPTYAHIRQGKLMKPFFIAFSAAFLFIFVRSVYRVVEMSDGWGSNLASNETYVMILEALMMLLACILMTVLYPGLVYGKNAHIYIDKTLKSLFADKKSGDLGENADTEMFYAESEGITKY